MPRTLNDNIAVFDIDGCISDDTWRRGRILPDANHPLQYDFYHAGCSDDPPLPVGADLLRKHIAEGDFIVFATARPGKVADLTAIWIKKQFAIEPSEDFMLLMRHDDDNRSAVEVKKEFASFLTGYCEQTNRKVVAAYDDRQDIIDMYRENGYKVGLLDANGLTMDAEPALANEQQTPAERIQSAADVLDKAAATYRERNAKYKDNAVMVGEVMKTLFPEGVTLRTASDHHTYHLFELMIVKLTRFVKSDLKHADSIHDLAVYAAMIEPLVEQHGIEVRNEWSE